MYVIINLKPTSFIVFYFYQLDDTRPQSAQLWQFSIFHSGADCAVGNMRIFVLQMAGRQTSPQPSFGRLPASVQATAEVKLTSTLMKERWMRLDLLV